MRQRRRSEPRSHELHGGRHFAGQRLQVRERVRRGWLDRDLRLHGIRPAARHAGGRRQHLWDHDGRARLQRRFQLAVGAHVHHVGSALDFGVHEIAQVEPGEAHRRAGAAADHAHVAFDPILHRIAHAYQIQAAREAEGEVVVGKAVPVGRIPVAAGTDVVDTVAGLVNHLAGMVELEFVLAPGA